MKPYFYCSGWVLLGVLLGAFQDGSAANRLSDADIVKNTNQFTQAEPFEQFPAGAATHSKVLNSDAFSFPSNHMSFERQLLFSVGNRLFTRNWVSVPSSTQTNGGIGPLFNARSCQACHFKDGRGHLPYSKEDDAISLILKIQNTESGAGDHIYGQQLQDFSTQGVKPEGKVVVDYTYSQVKLADGSIVELRKPILSVSGLGYGDLHKDSHLLPRIAPPMIGLGLLEAIDANDIRAGADINDDNKDGISGRVHAVVNEQGQQALGRFGWKAEAASLRQQTQTALFNDMGLSSNSTHFAYAQGDCTAQQKDCISTVNEYQPESSAEIPDELLEPLLFYVRNLAVPKRREPNSKAVLAGKNIFYQSGCTNCHRPKYITPVDTENIEQSRQLIWPYTDLLLHDMGEGLSDPQDSHPLASEWRTPPLWGIGLTALVNREYGFLHDGRARTILEAILWHGGEAQQSRDAIVKLSEEERRNLLLFVNSL